MADVYAITTAAGLEMIRRAVGSGSSSGEEITFVKFGFGDGEKPTDPTILTALVSEKVQTDVNSFEISTDANYVVVGTSFNNEDVDEQFVMREIGVYATTATYTTPTLFAYINQEDLSEIILDESNNKMMENEVNLQIMMDSTENVTASVVSSTYATIAQLQAHENAQEAHTKEQVGLGNVENVATKDATITYTESTENTELASGDDVKTLFGKLSKIVKSFLAHISGTAANAAHGNILSNGDITTNATIASGDRLVINDESDSRVRNSSITFGTGTTTYLRNDGTWGTPSAGTVTSVRVQATSPVVSSQNTEQTATLNTTISLADSYGETKNPYGKKSPNFVLAGPQVAGDPSAYPGFRKLVAADIPPVAIEGLTNFGTRVYDATTSRTKNTVLAAPNGSNGAATFRALVAADLPNATTSTKGAVIAGSGLTMSTATLNHASSITAGTAGTSSATSGATLAVPYVTYNATGHITAAGTHTHTIGSLNTSAITAGTLGVARGGTGVTALDGAVNVYNLRKQAAFASSTNPTVTGEIAWQYQ